VRLEAAGPAAPDRLYGVDQAAEALSLGRSLVYQEIANGRLRSLKVNRRRLIPASAITAYITDRQS
jgi:excisionase family DNA binding protein